MAKYKERIEARKMRRKGISIRKIAHRLGVSKSTVSLWCGDIVLTKEQQDKLIEDDKKGGAVGRANARISIRNERLSRLAEYADKGRKIVGQLSGRDILIAGIALYWAEGNKKNRRLVFTNSDPMMIKLQIKWLVECLGISRNDIYCSVGINQLHRDRVAKVEKYWSKMTGIPLTDFRQVSLKKVNSAKVYENFNEHYGTLNLIVKKSTNLNYLVLGFIDGMSNY